MKMRWVPAVLIFAAAVLAGAAIPALADNPPPSQVLSNYEKSTGSDIVRDCGYSTPLPADPADSLWLFCDTAIYGFNSRGQWGLSRFIAGSTAAVGPSRPGQVPTDLSELSTPGTRPRPVPNNDAPEPFLPAPAGLVTKDGLPCDSANHAYAASWITGVTRDEARPRDVLISFNDYCVAGTLDFLAEGSGLAEYDPAANRLDGDATPFAPAPGATLPAAELLGSPVFSGGYLYLFGSHCAEIYDATCISNGGDAVYLARVHASPADWANARDYRWYAGPSKWTASLASAISVVSGSTPLAVSVGGFATTGHGLVMIEQTNDVGAYTVYQASRPAGAWRKSMSGTVPCTAEGDSFCRAIIGHPELSTGGDLLVSYFDPAAAPYFHPSEPADGHVMIAAIKWLLP
jgi:hypothetical protein